MVAIRISICGLGIGMSPGFANVGVMLSAYRTIASGPVVAVVVYLISCAIAWHAIATEPTDTACTLDEERCVLYLRGRGASDLQARALARIAQGRTTEEICRELNVARGTVNAYRARGYTLLGIHTRRELAELLQHDTGVPAAAR